jgi:transposase
MDAREQRAEEIAAGGKIAVGDGCFLVPSQSSPTLYKVAIDPRPTCTCEDYELREKVCKHIIAVRLFVQRMTVDNPPPPRTEPAPKVKRKTYSQSWEQYNAAQTGEKDHFQDLLADLCSTVEEPDTKGKPGRPPIPLADQIFAAVFKVYSTVSGRRFMCDLEESHRRGYITRVPHFNSLFNAFDNPAIRSILVDLIRQSALPLAQVESDFAPDSSGFTTCKFTRWFDVKYGVTREKAEWVKVHIMTGVKTNVVTAVEIHGKDAADVTQFRPLLEATAKGFKVVEVSADKAYTATDCFQDVADLGGTLYAPFKSNATGGVGGIFEKMFHLFCLNREAYLQHYHKRSNVESTFSMIKRKFGDALRSKTDAAQVNESLAKLLCHNLCCLISAWHELGIDTSFGTKPAPDDAPKDVLRFPAG